MTFVHAPVLVDEVVNNLVDDDDLLFVDATVGGGGHGYRILERYPNLKLVGIDADEEALAVSSERLAPFGDRVLLKKGNFRDIKQILTEESIHEVDSVLFDLGISMYQMSGDRGFSFADAGNLDMRIDREEDLTAYDVVNRYDYQKLVRIIREYGEEGDGPRIARGIIEARKSKPIASARELAAIVADAKKGRGRIHPATKTFQALRIEVNSEFSNLEKGMQSAIDVVRQAGKIGVITFHSLEDRIVKNFFRANPNLRATTKKPIPPGRDEIRANRRARSAKLRIAERI